MRKIDPICAAILFAPIVAVLLAVLLVDHLEENRSVALDKAVTSSIR